MLGREMPQLKAERRRQPQRAEQYESAAYHEFQARGVVARLALGPGPQAHRQ